MITVTWLISNPAPDRSRFEPGDRIHQTGGFPKSASWKNGQAVVSGDHHLLNVSEYAGIQLVTVQDFPAHAFPGRIIGLD
jgi:hypothetical protein